MRLLTSNVPRSWKALQAEVAEILEECGFSVAIEKKVTLARGKAALDVYAEESVEGRQYKVACECKRWNVRVPQTVVHAFRTIVTDLGANVGYMISSKGFQSGAIEAAKYSNVELVTWQQFQDKFCESWLKKNLSPLIRDELDPLFTFTEPLVPQWFGMVPDHDKDVLRKLRDKYEHFSQLMMSFAPHSRLLKHGFPGLPLRTKFSDSFIKTDSVPDGILDAVGYKDFLDQAMAYGQKAIGEFRAVRKRNGV